MNALTDFLESEAYHLLLSRIQEADPSVNFDDTLDSFQLMHSFKQRHFVLNGSQGEVPDEAQAATWFSALLSQEQEPLFTYMKARFSLNKQLTDDGDGEFPEGDEPDPEDRSVVIQVLGYSFTAVADFMIEYALVKDHPKLLGDYFKHIRIPGAARFAGHIRKLYRSIQS